MSRKGVRGKTSKYVDKAKMQHLIKQNGTLVSIGRQLQQRCAELSDALVQTFKMANEFAGEEGDVVDAEGLRKWIRECTKIPDQEGTGDSADDIGGVVGGDECGGSVGDDASGHLEPRDTESGGS